MEASTCIMLARYLTCKVIKKIIFYSIYLGKYDGKISLQYHAKQIAKIFARVNELLFAYLKLLR
jgi:hypothetical protein